MIRHWGYNDDEHGDQYIDFQDINQEYVASLKHPLLSLFEEYTPKMNKHGIIFGPCFT